ncbi:MAG TPA: CBS domain-containing protein [Archangium sp.]|nr:CBS domain-containing protein [Archangium sp.]
MAKTIEEVMTRDVEVIHPNDTVREAAEKMAQLNVGPIPVCDGQTILGMITDRDIVVRVIAQGMDPNVTRVADAMTANVQYCFMDDDIDTALELMSSKQIRRLLVLDRNKKLVGIVALGDISQEASEHETAEALESISEPSAPMH